MSAGTASGPAADPDVDPAVGIPSTGAGRLRWGVAGCGWVARDHVAPALAADPSSQVVALLDPAPAARDTLAAAVVAAGGGQPGVSTDDPATFTAAGLDAVYVAAPNHLHRQLVELAAGSGIPVLCEKPMATTLADARAMVAACAQAGVGYATAFDQRHHPAHVALAAMIAAGELGTITAVRIAYGCWTDPGWRPDTSPEGYDNWRADPARAGGGALVDLAPHGLDLTGVLLGGDDVDEVVALRQRRVHDYAVDDGAVLAGRTSGDVLLDLHVSYNTPDALPRRRLEVIGTKAMAVAVNTMGQTPGGTLTVHDAQGGPPRDVPFDTVTSPFAQMVAHYAAARRGERAWPSSPERDLHHLDLLMTATGGPR